MVTDSNHLIKITILGEVGSIPDGVLKLSKGAKIFEKKITGEKSDK